MKTLNFDQLYKLRGLNLPIVIEQTGKNLYVVEVEMLYGGLTLKKHIFIIFADNVKAANSYITWLTDGNKDDMLKSYKDDLEKRFDKDKLEKVEEALSHSKMYGKIINTVQDCDYSAFIKKYGALFAGRLPE